eukprot:6490408-Amphidinium_carterae.2
MRWHKESALSLFAMILISTSSGADHRAHQENVGYLGVNGILWCECTEPSMSASAVSTRWHGDTEEDVETHMYG